MTELTIRPVTGIGEVRPGDDLAGLIAAAAPWLADGDVLVVTSKVVSKAEGRLVDLPPDGPDREAAREAVLAAETARPVARRGATRIVQTHHGFVLASAGVDASNVDGGRLVLLPVDPDASARALHAALRDRYGRDVGVIISDTMGRPWRLGLVDVAIGAAGIGALLDHRGQVDAYGNELHITQMAVIDELAAAADLVKGKRGQIPVAVIRGYRAPSDGDGARTLVRPAEQDLFPLGTAEARSEGLRAAAALPDAAAFADRPVDPAVVARAVAGYPVDRLDDVPRDKLARLLPAYTRDVLVVRGPGDDARTAARTGAAIHALRAGLAADGLASAWVDGDPDVVDAPLGLLAIGAPDQPDG